jgi:DNA polymerase-3 subunit delta
MKLPANNLSKLLDVVQSRKVSSFLLHGPNYGLSCAILKEVARKLSCRIVSYSDKDIRISQLASLFYENNLFGERQLIRISDVSGALPAELKKFLSNIAASSNISQNIICFIANDSLPASGIKKFYEENASLAVMGCYHESPEVIGSQICKFFAKHQKAIATSEVQYLQQILKGDYYLIKSELEKLLCYVAERSSITLEDIKAVISADLMANADDMCAYFASKDYKNFLIELEKIRAENISEVLIIRALIRYFMNLYQVKLQQEARISVDAAMRTLTPPIFYQNIARFKSHVNMYKITEILEILGKLHKSEGAFKLSPYSFDLFMALQ